MAISSPIRVSNHKAPLNREPYRVLLLSRNRQVRETLGPVLKAKQCEIQSSHPAQVELYKSNFAPDMVLLHEQDESSVLTQIQHIDAIFEQTPILLLVPGEQLATALDAQQCGAYDYILEPYTTRQVLSAIHRACEYRRLRLQNDSQTANLEQVIATRTETLLRAIQQIERSYDVTLEALGDALDLKDAETEGHSKRVTAYTLALGRAVGLSGRDLRIVGRGAFLHDIGKMAIPDSILRKPGKLTSEEQSIMRTHSELGYQMLRKIPFLHDTAEIVYAHQECYDGSGYPRGLRGEQIPMGARIFALADTLDAITSNRPYRNAASIDTARKEVLRRSGAQFDPSIVDVFLGIPDSLWQNLREGIMREGSSFSPFGFTFGEG